MQKRAAGLYREKEVEVRRMLEVEMEKAERLKAFNHVARRLMREELRVMDLEERQAYKDQLEEEMASERANSKLERAKSSTSASASSSSGSAAMPSPVAVHGTSVLSGSSWGHVKNSKERALLEGTGAMLVLACSLWSVGTCEMLGLLGTALAPCRH